MGIGKARRIDIGTVSDSITAGDASRFIKKKKKKGDFAGRFDDFLTTNFLTIFLFEDLSGRRTSRYRRRPGFSSPSMPLLVFWPHAGAWGAGVILPPCAQLLWCELYVMKDTKKKEKKRTDSSRQSPWRSGSAAETRRIFEGLKVHCSY